MYGDKSTHYKNEEIFLDPIRSEIMRIYYLVKRPMLPSTFKFKLTANGSKSEYQMLKPAS